MVENERDPVGAGLSAAAAVNAAPQQLGHDGHEDGEHDEAQNQNPPAIVIVQDQLHAGRDVRGHVQDEEEDQAEGEEGVAGRGHLADDDDAVALVLLVLTTIKFLGSVRGDLRDFRF